ncbi:MAG: DUF4339 domain-containing protein [Myxococcota bacterium]
MEWGALATATDDTLHLKCGTCDSGARVEPCLRDESFQVACRGCGAWIVRRSSGNTRTGRWYVVLAGETLGPLRATVVADLLRRRLLDEEIGVWRDGMLEWRPLAEVEPFARVVRQRDAVADPTRVLSMEEIDFQTDATVMLSLDEIEIVGTPTEPSDATVVLSVNEVEFVRPRGPAQGPSVIVRQRGSG